MPRNDLKAYGSVIARIPQDLLDQVKQYASQHRCTVSELIRDGLEMRLEAGGVPGRSTDSSPDHGEEVLHEVVHVLPEVLHTLSPMLLAQIQDTIRTTVTEVLHGHTSLLQPHTQGMPSVLPIVPTIPEPSEVLHDVLPPLPPTEQQGLTAVIPNTLRGMAEVVPHDASAHVQKEEGTPEVVPCDTSTPQPHAPSAEQGHTEALPHEAPTAGSYRQGMTEVVPDRASLSLGDQQGMTTVVPKHTADDFDATRFVLGKLCVNGHAYGDTGQTLYRLPKYVCPPCDAARARERRARQREG